MTLTAVQGQILSPCASGKHAVNYDDPRKRKRKRKKNGREEKENINSRIDQHLHSVNKPTDAVTCQVH